MIVTVNSRSSDYTDVQVKRSKRHLWKHCSTCVDVEKKRNAVATARV